MCNGEFEKYYYEHNGLRYCKNDYLSLFGVRCQQCSDFIEASGVSALGNPYHTGCLKCTLCQKQILANDHFVVLENKIYCVSCEEAARKTTAGALPSSPPPLPSPNRLS